MNINLQTSPAFMGKKYKTKKTAPKPSAPKPVDEFKTYGAKTRYDDITAKIKIDEHLKELIQQKKEREININGLLLIKKAAEKVKETPKQVQENVIDTINKIRRQAITLKNMRKLK